MFRCYIYTIIRERINLCLLILTPKHVGAFILVLTNLMH